MNINLRAHSQYFVCAEGGGCSIVTANRPEAGPWETFTLERYEDRYAFRVFNGMYIAAEIGAGGPIVTKHPWDEPGRAPGPAELFRIYRVAEGYAIQADNGMLWAASKGGGTPDPLVTKHPWDQPGHAPGPWETFAADVPLEAFGPIEPWPSELTRPNLEPPPQWPPAPGGEGILLRAVDESIRRQLNTNQIRAFLPNESGPFTFPQPWGTQGIRVTSAADGDVHPLGMAYWPNVNNHASRGSMHVFLSVNGALTLFSISKRTLAVQNLGPLPFHGTGEGCYWSLSEPDVLYVPREKQLLRYNVDSRTEEVACEATTNIYHCHSSYDGRVHSMELEGGPAVYRNGTFTRWSPRGDFDEVQVDKSGRWLHIKEGPPPAVADNRFIDLDTGKEFIILNQDGALGHSDMGFGYAIGEDDQAPAPGAMRLWLLGPDGPVNRGVVYHWVGWGGMTRYVSHCHAEARSPDNQMVVFSSADKEHRPRANELIAARLNDSLLCCAIAPNLVDLNASGGGPEYWRHPRANIDPTGEWVIWTANCGTDRVDAFMVRVPAL